MGTFKHPLHARRTDVMKYGLFLAVLTLILALSPAIKPLNNVQAAIDEAKPSSIPAEVAADWKAQGGDAATIKASLPDDLKAKCGDSFEDACHWRRVSRLKPFEEVIQKMFVCEHHNFGGIVVGYHDNVDAGNSDSEWKGNGKLDILNFKTYYPELENVLSENKVIRDPCVSFDGKKVLFAMSGSGSKGSGYCIYEMEIGDPKSVKQLTQQMNGITTADFEPCYMPNGQIAFSSSRNFGLTDCAYHPTVNMFIMNGDGKYMRQVGYDQVHTFYPQMQIDGSVLYTRWEYNDRDIVNSMGLFIMYPDGTHQTEFFGNQTSWPFTMQHARPIPNSTKVIAVAGGHHGPYSGELMLINNQKGYNGAQSIEMIAPRRETKPAVKKSDLAMGHVQFLFEYPYPLDEENFIVSWRSKESGSYRLYWMDPDGNRELLAWSSTSVCQAVPIATWKTIWGGTDEQPPLPKLSADYTKSGGTYTMENVYGDPYYGPVKMDPIPAGKAKTLRVVALGYRAQGSGSFGSVMGSAPSGLFAPAIFCPIATFGCSWEAKKVLGEATIHADGSAAFTVPDRTPVYFQVLDEKGYCLATMRSWSTLMPGETFSCFGCHENKVSAPPTSGVTEAMGNPPEELKKPLGIEDKWFDFKKMVAPILDKNCASCHKSGHTSGFDMRNTDASGPSRTWTTSYNSLTKGLSTKSSNKAINICYIFQQSEPEPYGSFGSLKSGMIKNIEEGHKNVNLTDDEKKIIACWIDLAAPHGGDYTDYLTKSGYDKLLARRTAWEKIENENIKEYIDFITKIDPEDHGRASAAGSLMERLKIGYLREARALVLKQATQGTFMLVDLRGRVISRMKLSDKLVNSEVTISLPSSLGTGLYLAKFEDVNGKIQQAKINVTQ